MALSKQKRNYAGNALMTTFRERCAAAPLASWTWATNPYEPAALGVPLRSPAVESDVPVGVVAGVPRLHVNGALPPLCARVPR